MSLWPDVCSWSITPVGRGCYEFQFNFIDDMRKVWAQRVVNMKPGLLRLFCWSKDFNPLNQAQTHAQIWVRLMHLPQEYLHPQTLLEIASGVGTPLVIDEATQARLFGLYARVLVDLSRKLFDTVVVEREGFAFTILVQYEKQPSFCSHCSLLGHTIQTCNKFRNSHGKEGMDNSRDKDKAPLNTMPAAPRMYNQARVQQKHGSNLQGIGAELITKKHSLPGADSSSWMQHKQNAQPHYVDVGIRSEGATFN